jgi:hypothetical protein
LFKGGHITHTEYEQAFLFIDRPLQRLHPSAQPEARQIAPSLKDFRPLWQQITLTEWMVILQAMFAGSYFNSQNQLRKVAAHDPYDRLLEVAQKGIVTTV